MDTNEHNIDNRLVNSTEPSEPIEMLGAIVKAKNGVEQAIIDMLKNAMEQEHFDSVLMPYVVPTGDSYVYLLISNSELITSASPLAPVMPIQGARALSSTTQTGSTKTKIAAVMRPCEVRAAIELSKLDQINLDNITLISMDCPGVVSIKLFVEDPKNESDKFKKGLADGDNDSLRQMCRVCDKTSTPYGDLHVGCIGMDSGDVLFIQRTQKGSALLSALGLKAEAPIEKWLNAADEASSSKRDKRKVLIEELGKNNFGLDNLLQTFSTCLKCHNCMRACPIDYCQLCYFESDDLKYSGEEYFSRASNNAEGSLRFPTDSLQYHLGRMLHMATSCVACGTCEDACPMSIPVAQIYSSVGLDVQDLFDYVSGRNPSEPMPLSINQEEEFSELEN